MSSKTCQDIKISLFDLINEIKRSWELSPELLQIYDTLVRGMLTSNSLDISSMYGFIKSFVHIVSTHLTK